MLHAATLPVLVPRAARATRTGAVLPSVAPPVSIEATASDRGLVTVRFRRPGDSGTAGRPEGDVAGLGSSQALAHLRMFFAELRAYLRGELREFRVPLDLDDQGTPFQRSVWSALRHIPYGELISYGDLARRVGRPGGARAVGQANGRNPIPIVVPCHRVVASGGGLGGFSAGLPVKRHLLAIEGARVAP